MLQPVDHRIPSSASSSILLNPQAGQELMDHNIPVLHEVSLSHDELVSDAIPLPCLGLSVLQADIIASISKFQVESGGDMSRGVHIIDIVQEIQACHPNITVPEFLWVFFFVHDLTEYLSHYTTTALQQSSF